MICYNMLSSGHNQKPMRQLRIVLLVSLFASFMSHAGTDFPRPKELQVDVDFWVRIYSQVDTNSGLIHDAWNLGAVYEEIDLPTPAISKVRAQNSTTFETELNR